MVCYRVRFSGTENIKAEIYLRGPIEFGVDSTKEFHEYTGGIYELKLTKVSINHDISVVGWGVDEEVEYWIGRNSWWGENGFFFFFFFFFYFFFLSFSFYFFFLFFFFLLFLLYFFFFFYLFFFFFVCFLLFLIFFFILLFF
jgi:hypothetical protein